MCFLYAYKQYRPDERITVILDECQDLYIDTDGSIDVMLRKGRKYGIRMLLASQELSAVNDKLVLILSVSAPPRGADLYTHFTIIIRNSQAVQAILHTVYGKELLIWLRRKSCPHCGSVQNMM